MNKLDQIIIHTDGGSRGNPGKAAWAGVALANGQVIFEVSGYLGLQTNNFAEYQGLINTLNHLYSQEYLADTLVIKMDSELVIKQIQGLYKVKEQTLKDLHQQAVRKIGYLKKNRFQNIVYQHIPRSQNSHPDKLVNEVLDQN